jgi:hypothetical protein
MLNLKAFGPKSRRLFAQQAAQPLNLVLAQRDPCKDQSGASLAAAFRPIADFELPIFD